MRAPRRHRTSDSPAPAAKSGKPASKAAQNAAKKGALPNLRLLPVTIFVAVLMLSVRINDVWKGFSSLGSATIEVNRSDAQQPPPPGGRKPGQRTPAASDTAAAAGSGSTAVASASNNASAGSAAPPAPPEEAGAGDGEPPTFTQNEIDVLQKLSVRREALDARQKDLDLRENLVKAAEARIDKKIAEMKDLQTNIEQMLKQVDRQDEEKLKSLVKIYENMKPKDAANILSTLELPVQLGVLGHMKEAKVAPILSSMDLQQAKLVTDAMAAHRAAKAEGQTN
jgi:flagellar motility protein MotE (MotC chaperone)